VSYTGNWSQADAARPWSGGTAASAASGGARAAVTFTGTEIRWIGLRGPQAGIARVVLDGAFHSDVDLYSGTETHGVVFEATGLTPGRHDLAVEVTGARNAAATEGVIVVDAFDVRSRLEERDSAVTYAGSWVQDLDRAWSGTSANAGGGTAARSAAAGARAELAFAGTAVRWIGYRGPVAGMADISLDGIPLARIDLYSAAEELQVPVFTATGLSAGSHTLVIQVTGLRNAAASAALVVVDAFDLTLPSGGPPVHRVQQLDPAVSYVTPGWMEGTPTSLYSGRTATVSGIAGARTEFTFTGSAVRWIGQRRRDGGIALVYVDGALAGEVDTFAPTQDEFQSPLFTRTGLSPGTHTLVVEVSGRKHDDSAGSMVLVDAFEIQ
jgi:trimeric autotransporter adhesin